MVIVAANSNQLSFDGLALVGPARPAKEAVDALYAKLEQDYGWGTEVSTYLREEMTIESLHDVLHSFKHDEDWREFYAADIKLSSGKQVPRAQRSRVSQLHEKLKKNQDQAQAIRDKGEEAVELEKPLGTEVLARMRRAFWSRYRIKIHISKMPGDLLLSRISKELEKQFLHVTDLMKIKGVVWERQSEAKKEQVGTNFYTDVRPENQDEVRADTVWNYLDVIEMYLLAMSIVGATPITPQPGAEEDMASDPSDYVVFPYQWALNYKGRAQAFVKAALKKHTPTQVFEMLKDRDRAERQKWVDKIRTTETTTIGKIFAEVYASRREDWKFKGHAEARNADSTRPGREKDLENQVRQLREQNAVLRTAKGQIKPTSKGGGGGNGGGAGSQGKGRRKGGGGGGGRGWPVTLDTLRNKRPICQDWNQGRCAKKCKKNPPEEHCCNGKLPGKDDIACGHRSHTSRDCPRCERA